MTERLHFHFSLSCIGEGNGNPLQCSCLENPRDRGVCWAAIYGVAQSRTRLKQLSSSSSSKVSVQILSGFFFSLIPLQLFLLRSTNDLKTEFIRLFSVLLFLGDSTVSDTLLLLLDSLIPPLNLLHYPLLDCILLF